MGKRKTEEQVTIEIKIWNSFDEINLAIKKLQRRVDEIEALDVRKAVLEHNGMDAVGINNVRDTILEVFGAKSPEYNEHKHIQLWSGAMAMGMFEDEIIEAKEHGKQKVIGILKGLIGRLSEKKEEMSGANTPPKISLGNFNLHPRIEEVARNLFQDGYHWEAVFAASKALINYVKERSNQYQLDGASLMRTVFSRNNPDLVFNDMSDQTDTDEQEGMMHLFEGIVLGIRNPGGHSFPEGPEQRAFEYLIFISMLAYRLQEAKKSS